jgi:endonuclease G
LITGFPSAFSFRPLTATNPLCGGISISNAATFSAGTLGGWVQDRHTQADMVLSNWHVLCCPWADWDDLPIYQPGRLDGGYAENTVAHLARHAMEQNIDAAVGALSGVRDLINKQRGIGIVTGVAIPRLGMQVIKSGRTTGVTSGIIDGVGGRRIFNYGGFSHMIREHIHIIPIPDGDQTVSSAGDSGAWWLDESTHCAVGLHFGGSDNPEYALAFSMPTVLDSLQVDIVV